MLSLCLSRHLMYERESEEDFFLKPWQNCIIWVNHQEITPHLTKHCQTHSVFWTKLAKKWVWSKGPILHRLLQKRAPLARCLQPPTNLWVFVFLVKLMLESPLVWKCRQLRWSRQEQPTPNLSSYPVPFVTSERVDLQRGVIKSFPIIGCSLAGCTCVIVGKHQWQREFFILHDLYSSLKPQPTKYFILC